MKFVVASNLKIRRGSERKNPETYFTYGERFFLETDEEIRQF